MGGCCSCHAHDISSVAIGGAALVRHDISRGGAGDLLECLETTLDLPGDFLDAWLHATCECDLVQVVPNMLRAGNYEVTFYPTNVEQNRHALLLIDFCVGSFFGTFAAEEAFVLPALKHQEGAEIE